MILFKFLSIIFGLILGSFLNVVIFRLPKKLSIITPRSFCPKCSITIPFYRNIPIISYVLQKGKCHGCESSISIQYPLIELTIALISFLSFQYFNFPEAIVFVLIGGILISISIIDYRYFIIPLSLSISSIIILIPYSIYYSNTTFHIYGMLIGLGYLSFIFITTWLITKKQPLGFGDLQLILILGLWLGPLKILLAIFMSALFGILYWILISFKNGYSKDLRLPFGTFLSITSILIYIIPVKWDLFSNF